MFFFLAKPLAAASSPLSLCHFRDMLIITLLID